MHEQARQPARRGAIALALLLFVAPLVHPASAQAECGNCSLALRKTCCVPPAGSSPGSPQTATACVAAPGSTSCTGEISSNFNGTAIPAGRTIWFSSQFKLDGSLGTAPASVTLRDATVELAGRVYAVPDALVRFDPAAPCASTVFDADANRWETTVPMDGSDEIFLSGFALPVVPPGLPGGTSPVVWRGSFGSDQPGLAIKWKWSAAVYTGFGCELATVGVKPTHDDACAYPNSHHAGTPEAFAAFVTGGARGGGGSNFTGSWSGTKSVSLAACPLTPAQPLFQDSCALPAGGGAVEYQYQVRNPATSAGPVTLQVTDDLDLADAQPAVAIGGPIQLFPGETKTLYHTRTLAAPTLNRATASGPPDAGGACGEAQDTLAVSVGGVAPSTDPPTVTISAPLDGALLAATPVLVSGTLSGAAPVSVGVNSVPAAVSGASFSASVPLTEGANTLTATAANAFGSAQASVQVTLDTTPPLVTITAPAAGTVTTDTSIQVAGTVEDASPIAVFTLNGETVALVDGTFSAVIPLALGANPITAVATDAAGNIGSDAVSVTSGNPSGPPLAIAIATPPPGAIVSSPVIPVAGSVNDATAFVAVNGFYASVTGTSYVAPAVYLIEGQNTLVATATRGTETVATQVVVTYHAPPKLVITSPREGARLRTSETDVEGIVDAVAAHVDVNGIVASVGPGGRFLAHAVPLAPGENLLIGRAIDPLGAQATDTVRVTREDGAAGGLRVVLASGGRHAFDDRYLEHPMTLVAEDLDQFREALDGLGMAPSEFDGPVDEIAFGFGQRTYAYVFAEDPGEVSLPAACDVFGVFEACGPVPLAPIEDLPTDVPFLLGRLDPAAIGKLVPRDFEARVFARFDLPLLSDLVNPEGRVDLVATSGAASDDLPVFVDLHPPTLTITSPAADSVIAGTSLTVSGTVSDAETAAFGRVRYVLMDESFVELGAGSAAVVDGRFTIPDLALGAGFECVLVFAQDTAGNEAGEQACITADPSAPAVALVSPADGAVLVAPTAPIDLNLAQAVTLVSVNGTPDGRVLGPGLVPGALELPLALGANAFELVFEGPGGSFVFSFTLFRVASVSAPRIVSPAPGARLNASSVTVRGTVPLGTPLVEVNGVAATLASDRVGFEATVPLSEGPNDLRVVAYPFGTTTSVQVVSDTIPPRLLAFVPEDGARTLDPTLESAGFASEPVQVTLAGPAGSVTGDSRIDSLFGNPLVGDGGFQRFGLPALPLVPGANAVSLTLRDAAGNQAVYPYTFFRVDGALVLVSPGEGAVLPGLRAALTVDALEEVTLDAAYVAGRRMPALEGAQLSGTVTLPEVLLAPGSNDVRLIYHRPGGTQEVLSFALNSAATESAVVRGTVSDATTGAALGGAQVTITIDGVALVVLTDASGRYEASVPVGQVAVSISREGFDSLANSGTAVSGGVVDIGGGLLPWSTVAGDTSSEGSGSSTSQVSGLVTDRGTGAPLAGALVQVNPPGTTTTTGSDGSFVLDGLTPGPFQVVVVRVGYFPATFDIGGTTPLAAVANAALEAIPSTATLVGIVENPIDGQPSPGVTATLIGSGQSAITDAQGRFVFADLPLGEQTLGFSKPGFLELFSSYTLLPKPEGYPSVVHFRYPGPPGFERTLVVGTTAIGVVTDGRTSSPLAGATVEAGNVSATSAADGSFVLPGLPSGPVRITASRPGFSPSGIDAVVVPNGDEPAEIALTPLLGGTVQGVVSDAATGLPVQFAEVRPKSAVFLAGASDASGAFSLPFVTPGTYTLEVVSPEHFPLEIENVSVAADQTVAVNAALTHRPTTGGIAGQVRRVDTGLPVSGVSLTLADGRSTVTAADGRYAFSGVRAGLVAIDVVAPGFGSNQRAVLADADIDAATPSITSADILLDPSGTLDLTEGSAVIRAEDGGAVESPDGRLRLDIPAGSLTGDGKVSVRLAPQPVSTVGATLATDAALQTGTVTALADEVEVLVEPPASGEPKPRIVGPVFVSMRYFGDVAEAAHTNEATAFPYFYDGAAWTALRTVPYLHAVDRINKIVVVALLFGETETGRAVLAEQMMRHPMLLAQASGGGFTDVVVDLYRFIVGAAEAGETDQPPTEIIDLADDPALNTVQSEPPYYAIDVAARPVLVWHGWSPQAILRDVPLVDEPMEDKRYRPILGDLVGGTNGLYRPIFLTYNSRLRIAVNANRLVAKLLEKWPNPAPGETLEVDLFGPPGIYPSPKAFGTFDGFGFSMGGLMERAYQQASFAVDPAPPLSDDADPDARRGRISRMVTMGAPHHGALQALRDLTRVGESRVTAGVGLETLFGDWSPGTFDLLDYNDGDSERCDRSGNPFLCALNRDPKSGPGVEAGLIGGTKSSIHVPLGPLGVIGPFELSRFVVEGEKSDGVVPLSSAQGQSTKDRRLAEPLISSRRSEEGFDHFNAGTLDPRPVEEGGEGDQRIQSFVNTDVVSLFQDHFVWRRGIVNNVTCPTLVSEGHVNIGLEFDYKATQEGLTGIGLVLYLEDPEHKWHIAAGADPNTGELDSQVWQSTDGNSRRNLKPASVTLDTQLSRGLDAQRALVLVHTTGSLSSSGGKAYVQLPPDEVAGAETLGRIRACN